MWDPERTGKITSGRQLFGSVTWWIFWEDGYQPLSFLDDDRDGQLSGDELKGLSVWRDRNQNAVSEKGKVLPLAEHGIVSVEIRPDGNSSGVPSHSAGVDFSDGRHVPSYDWTPMRADNPPPAQTLAEHPQPALCEDSSSALQPATLTP